MKHVVAPLLEDERVLLAKPVLAFATTKVEKQQLATCFTAQKSVSLYGNYGAEHEEGVDVRDLARYPRDTYAGVFGVLLFDYFPEHEIALRECFRVIAPGGIFLTHITPSRLTDDDAPPRQDADVRPRADYFSYLPSDKSLPTAHVGRKWFIHAMMQTGFQAAVHPVRDEASKRNYDWFLGIKPRS